MAVLRPGSGRKALIPRRGTPERWQCPLLSGAPFRARLLPGTDVVNRRFFAQQMEGHSGLLWHLRRSARRRVESSLADDGKSDDPDARHRRARWLEICIAGLAGFCRHRSPMTSAHDQTISATPLRPQSIQTGRATKEY